MVSSPRRKGKIAKIKSPLLFTEEGLTHHQGVRLAGYFTICNFIVCSGYVKETEVHKMLDCNRHNNGHYTQNSYNPPVNTIDLVFMQQLTPQAGII